MHKSMRMRKLKAGVMLFHSAHEDRFYCGTHKRAIRIDTPEEKSLVQALAAGRAEAWDATEGDSYRSAQQGVLEKLSAAALIDERPGVITLSKRFTSKNAQRAEKNRDRKLDGAYQQMQNRLAPELNQSTWLDGVVDGGVSTISARQRFTVEISGSSRIALLLYPLLLASGVTHVRFAEDFRKKSPFVGDREIGITRFSQEDIGAPIKALCESWRRDLSLFPIDKEIDYEDTSEGADLAVHCGEMDPEIFSQWMSTGQNFLHIAEPEADRATVGPLVIPGKSPCLRCYQLALSDNSDIVGATDLHPDSVREFPVIAAHYIASLAASQIIHFLDSINFTQRESSELVGTVYAVDYQLLSHPEVIAIARHPLCGCAF